MEANVHQEKLANLNAGFSHSRKKEKHSFDVTGPALARNSVLEGVRNKLKMTTVFHGFLLIPLCNEEKEQRNHAIHVLCAKHVIANH